MSKREKKTGVHFWRQPRFRYGSVSTLLLCLCINLACGL